MAGSVSPKPSFHLCPDFNIPPPPNGHLQLGSVLRSIDINGVLAPLDLGATVEVPGCQLLPKDGPQEKMGFVRSLKELRSIDGSIWAKLFSSEGLGSTFSFLRKRQDDEILQVDKLLVRYFNPTLEYMKQALEVDGVAFFVRNTRRKKPVYIVTGLMWAEGAKLSKLQSGSKSFGTSAAATDPSSGTSVGIGGSYGGSDSLSSSFEGSRPFILGLRVRKVWWDKTGMRQDAIDRIGTTLGSGKDGEKSLLSDCKFLDDDRTGAQEIVDEEQQGVFDPVIWVLS